MAGNADSGRSYHLDPAYPEFVWVYDRSGWNLRTANYESGEVMAEEQWTLSRRDCWPDNPGFPGTVIDRRAYVELRCQLSPIFRIRDTLDSPLRSVGGFGTMRIWWKLEHKHGEWVLWRTTVRFEQLEGGGWVELPPPSVRD